MIIIKIYHQNFNKSINFVFLGMFKKLFKLNALLFLLLSGYFIYAKANPVYVKASEHQKHASFKAAPTKSTGEQLVNNSGIPAQIVNFQRHKTVHYVQHVLTRFNESVTYIRYLDFICGRYSSELSLYRPA